MRVATQSNLAEYSCGRTHAITHYHKHMSTITFGDKQVHDTRGQSLLRKKYSGYMCYSQLYSRLLHWSKIVRRVDGEAGSKRGYACHGRIQADTRLKHQVPRYLG